MLELIKQRLKSKTYIAALLASILTLIDANSGIISSYVPLPERTYLVMLWPILMLTLREVTNSALADK
jgi:hypothetical protein